MNEIKMKLILHIVRKCDKDKRYNKNNELFNATLLKTISWRFVQ
jgi:hypothetical protein